MVEAKSVIICRLPPPQAHRPDRGRDSGLREPLADNSWALYDKSRLSPDLLGRLALRVTGLCGTRPLEIREAVYPAVLKKSLPRYRLADPFCSAS